MSETSPLPLSLLPNVLHASPEFASTILDALADAVVVYDATGRIVAGNPAAATLFGLTPSGRGAKLATPIAERAAESDLRTLEGQPLPYEERPGVRVLHGETLSGTKTVDVITRTEEGRDRVLNVSGSPLLDAGGQVMGAVCVYRDITDRDRLTRELVERAAEMESIFATQVEAVALADTTGRIIRMNEAQRQLLIERGYQPRGGVHPVLGAESQCRTMYSARGYSVSTCRSTERWAVRRSSAQQAVDLYQHAAWWTGPGATRRRRTCPRCERAHSRRCADDPRRDQATAPGTGTRRACSSNREYLRGDGGWHCPGGRNWAHCSHE